MRRSRCSPTDPNRTMLPDGPPTGGHVHVEGPMADLAYALLMIAGFALLVLTLRGLDSL